MGVIDNAKDLTTRLKLGSHHKIERFSVILGVITVSFGLLVISTGVSAWNNSKAELSAAAIYSDSFVTSLTQQSGSVEGVYVSEDSTQALVMMELAGGSGVQQVWSNNAENYQGFLGAVSPSNNAEPLKTDIEGRIVIFGTTGYMGVVLDAEEPFSENAQILALTMRNNSELVVSEDVDETLIGTSFADHDQWRVFFNPGASEAVTLSSLGESRFTPGAVFSEIVLAEEEAEIHQQLESSLVQMRTDLRLIAEYESELERTSADGVRLQQPEVPAAIRGDQIIGDPAVRENGETVSGSTLELDTDWISPRGWELPWRERSVMEGFLEELTPEGETYYTYLDHKAAGVASGASADAPKNAVGPVRTSAGTRGSKEEFDAKNIEWILTDGTDLTDVSMGGTGGRVGAAALTPLRDLMNSLSGAYQNYYDNKILYQVTQHRDLLELELELRGVESSYSMNDSAEAVQTH